MTTRQPFTPHTQPHPASDPVPLSVWPCAQTSAQYQRAGRYLPASTAHPGKMAPELARRIITAYSRPADLVVDPMCGIGTTLVEAAALGRRVIGVELEDRWAQLAVANCEHVLAPEQQRLVEVRTADARRLATVLAGAAGTVDLIVVSPPYACAAGVIDKPGWIAGRRMCPPDTLGYGGPANLGHARGAAYAKAMAEIYTGCYQLLKPGGLLVTVTKNTRRKARLFDLAGLTAGLCQQAGFGYTQHVVALLAAVRDGELVARPSLWQLVATRGAISRGEPAHLIAHEDVLVFAKPETSR
ncbi:MAG: TRM11 family SAM-dependent methyltransferase [Mycobacteriales bacterium]